MMEFIDYILLKLLVLCVVAFVLGFFNQLPK